MFARYLSCLLMAAALLAVHPLRAELEGAGLEGGSGLGGGGGLAGGGGLQTSRLQGGALKTDSLQGSKLESAKPQQAAKLLNAAMLKSKARDLAENGLGIDSIQGAVSTIPRTQVGALLYDVAGVLMMKEGDMTDTAVGYYMAVLADPQGERHDDALARLREIFLDRELPHEDAVRLYGAGLETMKSLVDINIGLTADGYQAGLRTLQEVKTAYQERRKREGSIEPSTDETKETAPADGSIEDRPVTGNEIDGLLNRPSNSNWQREDVGKQVPTR